MVGIVALLYLECCFDFSVALVVVVYFDFFNHVKISNGISNVKGKVVHLPIVDIESCRIQWHIDFLAGKIGDNLVAHVPRIK